MAKYKHGSNAKYADAVVSDDEDDGTLVQARKICDTSKEVDSPVHQSIFSLDGKAFSAITRTILPTYFEDPNEPFDEFGFRKHDDEATPGSSKDIEDSGHKMKFISLLEFAHSEVKDELKWSHINVDKIRGEKLEELVKKGGIPHSLRPYLWYRLSGAKQKKDEAGYSYADVLRQSAQDKPSVGVQIERSLLRAMPNNVCFRRKNANGVETLRRILKSIAFLYPDLGFSEGMGTIAANMLLICSEEATFWIMAALVEDILPPNFYSQTLLGVQADERVTRQLIKTHVHDLSTVLDDLDVEMSVITVNWLLSMFASVLPIRVLIRVWDLLFVYGCSSIFRLIISVLKVREDEIVELANSTKSSADVFNSISQTPSQIESIDQVAEYMTSFEFTITDHVIAEMRKKHQAILMADQGMIVNTATNTNLPKQTMQKRKLTRSKSIIKQIFHSKDQNDKDPKLKNVRQTEILVDLKESVSQICRYFIGCDDKMELNIVTQADYCPESHKKDEDNFLSGRRLGKKRARALLDFARQEEDELGFRKNDLITIISEKDEHCWVGEVNGLRGWFPAKFVEVVDERGKNYTVYGDEMVSPEITEYIRGRLANSFRQIMDHGIRESLIYPSTAYHPWSFIEEIAFHSVEGHFNAVYSRLTLCNTFNLDQDGKILTPEELLFRSVQQINDSHNVSHTHPDVKLRSLLVLGVNEQCLHLWFDLLCSCIKQEHIRNKFYHSWAFIRTPAWKQIKCELRLLSQFSFNLCVDFELDEVDKKKKKAQRPGFLSGSTKKKMMNAAVGMEQRQSTDEPLKQGVTDMLIKHSLFSWDI